MLPGVDTEELTEAIEELYKNSDAVKMDTIFRGGKTKNYDIGKSQDVKSRTKKLPPNIFQENISDFKYEFCTESGIDSKAKVPKTRDCDIKYFCCRNSKKIKIGRKCLNHQNCLQNCRHIQRFKLKSKSHMEKELFRTVPSTKKTVFEETIVEKSHILEEFPTLSKSNLPTLMECVLCS